MAGAAAAVWELECGPATAA